MPSITDAYVLRQQRRNDLAQVVRPVFDPSSISAFGNMITAPETLVVNIQFPYGIMNEQVYASGVLGGYVSSSLGRCVVATGTGSTGFASLESKTVARYVAGQGVRAKFAGLFGTASLSSSQELGIGDDTDGYFFGYSGSQFGTCVRRAGVESWTPQSSWLFERMDGTGFTGQNLCPQSGNVYMVDFQWLGFGAIRWFVEEAASGQWTHVHTTQYANANTVPSVQNPTLPVRVATRNWGNTTDIRAMFSSMGAYVEGVLTVAGNRRSTNVVKNLSTNELPMLAILNSGTFNGLKNRVRVRLDFMSVANQSASPTEYRLVLNPTPSGSHFSYLSASNSPVAFDTGTLTITGGREIFAIEVAQAASSLIDLSPYEFRLDPNDAVYLTASGSTNNSFVSLSWLEEF